MLVHLRGRVVREAKSRWSPERLAMDALARVFASRGRYERAQRLARARQRPARAAARPAERLDGDARAARAAAADVPRVVVERGDERERGLDRADEAGRSHGGPP